MIVLEIQKSVSRENAISVLHNVVKKCSYSLVIKLESNL